MAKNDYEFTYCIRYNEEKIVSNLPFKTKEYAAMAARYIVDLMVHEAAGTDKPYDPARFKLHYRPMKSGVSNVRIKPMPHVPSTQPATTAPPVEAPAVEEAKAPKAKRVRKAKAETEA